MADESDTLTVRMLRVTGRDDKTQWFEYRPAFLSDIVRISWELDTMDVELDSAIADYLLRAGYAAPLPQGSAPQTPPVKEPEPPPPPPEPTSVPWAPPKAEEPPPPPPAPSWLKPQSGG